MKIRNKYIFFLRRIWRDITKPTRWPISDDLHSQRLGEYYFLFTEERVINQKGGQPSITFDEHGIPMNYTYIDVAEKDTVYFPITIGQYGLAVFHTWLKSGSEEDKARFLRFPDWFLNNAFHREGIGTLWLTDVPLPQYHNPGPWASAFVQSRAISVLLRGYQMTGNEDYRICAESALQAFTVPVEKGGVTSKTEWGPFYEEYTAEVPTLVFNGMVFSMCGVYDFLRVFPDSSLAKKLYNEGLDTLENVLPELDLGYWSKYNLCTAEWYPKNDPATITYQHLHITQLDCLYKMSNRPRFRKYQIRFQNQIKPWNIAKMYLRKYRSLKELKRI